jgi:transposase
VTFTLRLTPLFRQHLYRRLQQAYASGSLRLGKRLHALLAMAEGMTVHDVAQRLGLGEQTVRDYLNSVLGRGVASLVSQRPPGRPAQLTKTQRKALATWIEAGPQAAGYASGCWSATIIHDLMQRQCGVEYHPPYLCALLQNLGFSTRKRALSPITSIRSSAWSGVNRPGPPCGDAPANARPSCSLAMRPALPNGARCAIPGRARDTNLKC